MLNVQLLNFKETRLSYLLKPELVEIQACTPLAAEQNRMCMLADQHPVLKGPSLE